jgi:hypothetical protein
MKKSASKKAGPTKPRSKPKASGSGAKPMGGAVSRSRTTARVGKSAVPADAIVLLSDEAFSTAVIDELKRRFDAKRIADEFEALLSASVENKFGETIPDARTRLAALEKAVHLTVGKPIEKTQAIQTTTYTHEELEELIAHSQALRRALREMLAPYEGVDLG